MRRVIRDASFVFVAMFGMSLEGLLNTVLVFNIRNSAVVLFTSILVGVYISHNDQLAIVEFFHAFWPYVSQDLPPVSS
jgi:hypothetical protein